MNFIQSYKFGPVSFWRNLRAYSLYTDFNNTENCGSVHDILLYFLLIELFIISYRLLKTARRHFDLVSFTALSVTVLAVSYTLPYAACFPEVHRLSLAWCFHNLDTYISFYIGSMSQQNAVVYIQFYFLVIELDIIFMVYLRLPAFAVLIVKFVASDTLPRDGFPDGHRPSMPRCYAGNSGAPAARFEKYFCNHLGDLLP